MTLQEKKALISRFLRQCNEYADAELARYRQQLSAAASGRDALALQDKISHWTAYRAFNEHAMEELAGDMLDSWFDEPDSVSEEQGRHSGR
jgi:hypothetical protein